MAKRLKLRRKNHIMLKKTSIMFREDVKEGYKHYQYFIRHWTMVLSAFEKTMCPVPVTTSMDVNSDLIKIGFNHPEEEYEIESNEIMWNELTSFLKAEGFNYLQAKNEWAVYIHIEDFVETVLSKPELYRWDGRE